MWNCLNRDEHGDIFELGENVVKMHSNMIVTADYNRIGFINKIYGNSFTGF